MPPPASISIRYAGIVPIRFWGATDLTPRYPKIPLMPIVLGFLKETNIPLWYCDVVSLPDPMAETDGLSGSQERTLTPASPKFPPPGADAMVKRAPGITI